jgi:hypothetical protein
MISAAGSKIVPHYGKSNQTIDLFDVQTGLLFEKSKQKGCFAAQTGALLASPSTIGVFLCSNNLCVWSSKQLPCF